MIKLVLVLLMLPVQVVMLLIFTVDSWEKLNMNAVIIFHIIASVFILYLVLKDKELNKPIPQFLKEHNRK